MAKTEKRLSTAAIMQLISSSYSFKFSPLYLVLDQSRWKITYVFKLDWTRKKEAAVLVMSDKNYKS